LPPVEYGICSLRMKLRRRTSARSSFRLRATQSMLRSRMKLANGRPAPRMGEVGTALVKTTSMAMSIDLIS
jgi:hypothetical protein